MLEVLRRNQKNWLIGFFLLIICLVFIVNFGPQSQGCGASTGTTWAARVAGGTITENEFRAAYLLSRGPEMPVKTQRALKLRQNIMDGLVERELLAREARERGLEVTEADVDKEILKGNIYRSASAVTPSFLGSGPVRFDFRNEEGVFQYQNFKRFVQRRLRRSPLEFKEEQAREILAERMRQLVTAPVRVGEAEVYDAYAREKLEVSLRYIRFSPLYYRDTLEPTPEQIAGFRESNGTEVDREYDRQKYRYQKLDKQAHTRHLLLKVAAGATDEEKAAVRARIDGLLARARAGEDFAALARRHSEDTSTRRRGGDLGWRTKADLPDETVGETTFSLPSGALSDVVQSQYGFHIVQVLGFREGDVPIEDVKNELAERLYREQTAQDRARQAAEQALARLKAGDGIDTVSDAIAAAERPAEATPEPADPPPADEPADEDEEPAEPEEPEEPEDELAPRVRDTQPFNRTGNPIPGPYDPQPILRAAFSLDAEAPVAQELVRAGDSYFVLVLKERTEPNREDFATQREAIERRMQLQKQRDMLALYVSRLRKAADADGEIEINEEVLRYEDETMADDEDGDAPPPERQEDDAPADTKRTKAPTSDEE